MSDTKHHTPIKKTQQPAAIIDKGSYWVRIVDHNAPLGPRPLPAPSYRKHK